MHSFRILVVSVTALIAPLTYAQDFGNWTVGKTNDGAKLYAATINDSGNILGQYCSLTEGTCTWLLGLSIRCKVGDKYPILINAESGAASSEVYCFESPSKGISQYAFTNFDQADTFAKTNVLVGLAFPMVGDQFKVIRFDLADANRAINSMLKRAGEQQQAPSKKSTKDRTL